MIFNGDIDKLDEFITKFKSYLESINEENENIQGLMIGFSSSISMTGNSYDAEMGNNRSRFVSAAEALKGNLDATVTELIKLKT